MAVQLVTDQLSTELDDKFRSQLIGNFKAIENALSSLDNTQSELSKEYKVFDSQLTKINGKLNTLNVNTQALVDILMKYDVPIQMANGKVAEIKEGE